MPSGEAAKTRPRDKNGRLMSKYPEGDPRRQSSIKSLKGVTDPDHRRRIMKVNVPGKPTVLLLAGEVRFGEGERAIRACNDYLRMSHGRSPKRLWEMYTDPNGEYGPGTNKMPPSTGLTTIRAWYYDFGWKERAELFDEEEEIWKQEERKRVLRSGLAEDFERVKKLGEIAAQLEKYIDDPDRILPKTRKSIKLGPQEYEEVIEERFNAPLVEQFRGVLDDIAKETGGRKAKIEHEGIESAKIAVLVGVSMDDI